MQKILGIFLATVLWLSAGEINIAVAANVSYVIEPLIEVFNENHAEIKVNVILGSSGKLTAQINAGAPYQLFLSANMDYVQKLYEDNLTLERPRIYAQGALAVLSTKIRDFNNSLSVLEDADIQKIAIANPKTAPYGKAAVETLKNAKLYQKLEKKLVYGESVSQTVIYATTAADIGLVAKSALFSKQMSGYKEHQHWKDVDTELYTAIDQGMVILKSAKENIEVQTFYDFLLSSKAKEVFKAYGYSTL
ncbi:MAG: molybdate ABC transporter substrate-binding protein [Sulfurovum sp.]|nr:molybdate ABC transporter substrate-binding protein [Sulfurovum sp.]